MRTCGEWARGSEPGRESADVAGAIPASALELDQRAIGSLAGAVAPARELGHGPESEVVHFPLLSARMSGSALYCCGHEAPEAKHLDDELQARA